MAKQKKITADELAERISCDRTTIFRYENGKARPDPDTMYDICEALGDVDVWTKWMRSEFPRSYGRIHPETIEYGLCGALLMLYAEISDLMEIQNEVMHDGADGKINDEDLARKICKEVTDLIMSAQRVKSLIEEGLK